MVVSDSKKFIFLHNPKAAGTSVRLALLAKYDTRSNFFWGPVYAESLGRRLDKAHMALQDLRVVYPGEYALLNEYFVFAFVRNPYERYVSSFAEYLKHYRKNIKFVDLEQREILDMIADFSNSEISERRVKYNYQYRHFMPQNIIIYCGDKSKVDFVGRMESIEQSLLNISKLLGLEIVVKIREVNKQARKLGQLHHDLPVKVRDLVKKIYEKDFMYFNYDM